MGPTLQSVFGPNGPFLHSGLSVRPQVTHTCIPSPSPLPCAPAPMPSLSPSAPPPIELRPAAPAAAPKAAACAFFARFFSRPSLSLLPLPLAPAEAEAAAPVDVDGRDFFLSLSFRSNDAEVFEAGPARPYADPKAPPAPPPPPPPPAPPPLPLPPASSDEDVKLLPLGEDGVSDALDG